jgi:hypothetical protein
MAAVKGEGKKNWSVFFVCTDSIAKRKDQKEKKGEDE